MAAGASSMDRTATGWMDVAHLATITAYAVFPSWTVLLEALTTFTIPPELMKIQKIE
jgi:hypothetical protein